MTLISSMPRRIQFSSHGPQLPGFQQFSGHILRAGPFTKCERIYIRWYFEYFKESDILDFLSFVKNELLDKDGRIDIRVPDFVAISEKFFNSNQGEALILEKYILSYKTLFWEQKITDWLQKYQYSRIERIKESSGIHMIAFAE